MIFLSKIFFLNKVIFIIYTPFKKFNFVKKNSSL